MTEVTGILKNWKIVNSYGFDIVWGNVYDDAKERFSDGAYIHTSYVTEKQDHGDYYIFVTRNSIYRCKKEEEVIETHDSDRVKKSGGLAGS